jgi:hypothetical protein
MAMARVPVGASPALAIAGIRPCGFVARNAADRVFVRAAGAAGCATRYACTAGTGVNGMSRSRSTRSGRIAQER